MSARWAFPLDPACPEVRSAESALYGDPVTKAMGAPVDEIMRGFALKHRCKCRRCQDYGAEHVSVEY